MTPGNVVRRGSFKHNSFCLISIISTQFTLMKSNSFVSKFSLCGKLFFRVLFFLFFIIIIIIQRHIYKIIYNYEHRISLRRFITKITHSFYSLLAYILFKWLCRSVRTVGGEMNNGRDMKCLERRQLKRVY